VSSVCRLSVIFVLWQNGTSLAKKKCVKEQIGNQGQKLYFFGRGRHNMSTSTEVPTHFPFPQSGLTSIQHITSHTNAVKSHAFDINDISLLASNGTNCMYKVMVIYL